MFLFLLLLCTIIFCHTPLKYKIYKFRVSHVPKHRIMMMAFATNSKYALLTSARELWIGSTGHDDKVKVRPSLGYSVVNLIHYNKHGINDAIPFTIMFDSFNHLFE